jgi:hypothetical protein
MEVSGRFTPGDRAGRARSPFESYLEEEHFITLAGIRPLFKRENILSSENSVDNYKLTLT